MAKEKPGRLTKTGMERALSPFEEMEAWFDESFRRPFPLLSPSLWGRPRLAEFEEIAPSVDIFEEGNDLVVKAELPGMKKEEIEISLKHESITISGEKSKEEKVERKNVYRLERSFGSFSRTFRLPTDVQAERATAKFENGVLEVRIPKTEEAQKKEKKIQIH